MRDTKEEILKVSLVLFARDGFEAVSTGAIAGVLGMTKAALYKHYKNKQDIFDSIVVRMEEADGYYARMFGMPTGSVEEMPEEYKNVSIISIGEYCKKQYDYWTNDEVSSAFRKILTLEQFRNPQMTRLFHKFLDIGPIIYFTDIFSRKYEISEEEARKLALELYSPMYIGYSIYDGAEDKFLVRSLAHKHIYETVKSIYEKYSD